MKDQFFDVIVASNSLEHVEGVEKFFFSAVRLLKPSGILMIAVPIVRNQEVVAEQLSNPFHVNLWSAGHWYRTLTSYFREVECHAHLFNSAESPELDTRSAVATFRENDFLLPAVELEDLTRLSSYTSIFVASKALVPQELPPANYVARIADHSVTRSLKTFWARGEA